MQVFEADVLGERLTLCSEEGLFSPGSVDAGTLAMLKCLEVGDGEKALDLGCGYGVVGLYLAKRIGPQNTVLCDQSPVAVRAAQKSASLNQMGALRIVESDGYSNIPDRDFSLILSNPPYHTDFSVAKRFIEGAFTHLRVGGRLMMVTKRETWYKNKLTAVFGGVKVQKTDGYFVFTAIKKDERRPAKQKTAGVPSKKLRRKMQSRRE